jgi:AcrR family transcriptional regulator
MSRPSRHRPTPVPVGSCAKVAACPPGGQVRACRRRPGDRALSRDQLRQQATVRRVAEGLFAARGYRGTSIHLVAERAHCSVGQVYNLYENKRDLYLAILRFKMDSLRALVIQTMREEAAPREGLRLLLGRVLEFFQKNTAFFRIYADETGPGLGLSRDLHAHRSDDWHSQTQEQLVSLIRQGQETGDFRADVAAHAMAVTLIGVTKAHVTEWVCAGGRDRLSDRAGVIWDLLLAGIGKRKDTA